MHDEWNAGLDNLSAKKYIYFVCSVYASSLSDTT